MVLGGHLDTVPANGNPAPRRDGDTLHGLGTADMKGGLAIMLALAEAMDARPADAAFDVTLVFYVGEEIAEEYNGLRDLFAGPPELVAADLAILLEPTDGWVEAGCQGTLHLRATYRGARAHTAGRGWGRTRSTGRPRRWPGSPAATRTPADVDGLEYRQALQAVRVEGGIANNVVPDGCTLIVNRRFAPNVSRRPRRRGRDPRAAGRRRRDRGRQRVGGGTAEPVEPADRGTGRVLRPRGAPEAGLDRCRPVRGPRDPGLELRSRRPDPRPHRR